MRRYPGPSPGRSPEANSRGWQPDWPHLRTQGDRTSRQPDTLRAGLVGSDAVTGGFFVDEIPNLARTELAPNLLMILSNRRRQSRFQGIGTNAVGFADNQSSTRATQGQRFDSVDD